MVSEVVTIAHVNRAIRRLSGFYGICIPEFTFGDHRIDMLVVDVRKRWARGFEIKMSRADYLADHKWPLYTQFSSSLSIACPHGLIQAEEVSKPFGLLWVAVERGRETITWARKPKKFQHRDSMAWVWRYISIIEKELPRLEIENEQLRRRLEHYEARECPLTPPRETGS